MYNSIEEATQALQTAEQDVIADHDETLRDQAWSDIVNAIASDCTPEVASELRRIHL